MADKIYNSRILDTYLQFIRTNYPYVDIEEILDYAGLEPYEIADQGSWFNQDQVHRFYQKCVQLTGNENIAREAGRFAAAPGTLGVMRQYTLSLLSPLRAFTLVGKTATRNFSKSADYVCTQKGKNAVELVVTPREGIQEEEFQCKNRIGFFEAIVTIFNLSAPTVEHAECIFEGGDCCRYTISWKETGTLLARRFRNGFGLLAVVGNLALLPVLTLPWLLFSLAASMVVLLLLHARVELHSRQELLAGMGHLWDSTEQLAEQINVNYRNVELSRKVGEVIANKISAQEVVDSVVRVLEQKLDYDRGLIMLANEETRRLEICGAFGYVDQYLDILMNISFGLDNPESRGPFVVSFREQEPFLVNDVEEIMGSLTPKSRAFVKALDTKSFICCPILLRDKSIGVLAVDNLKTKRTLVASDVNLLLGIAPAIAVSIHNAKLIEAQAQQFDSTLRVLADSIDARDFLTAGHSDKVAVYAEAIANELVLPAEEVRMIRTAALLHDYGKIGVPDSVLKKDGPLTEEERAIIQTHPEKSRQILEHVSFEGLFRQIPKIVHTHHERWDGTGYPNGLKGTEIPLGARIIAVADFYEAITSLRHYRAPMLADKALQLLLDESGRHFQPEVVDAFVHYLRQESLCLIGQTAPAERSEPFKDSPSSAIQRSGRLNYRTEVSTLLHQRTLSGSSVNISTGGVFIKCHHSASITPGMTVTLTLNLPGNEELVQCDGRVVWVNFGEKKASTNLPDGFAVEFSEPNQKLTEALEHYSRTAKSESHMLH
jgi:HD-GYP domain-containing protein (c-di-GMP phosphodiesterase class II)/Tfp pilus assembly protein PilZ